MPAPLRLLLPLVCLLTLGSEAAQAQKIAKATRTETPPVIDGVLVDTVWEQAVPFDNFRQLTPFESEPTERTEVRVLYDSDYIYFAVRAYDSDPSGIIATTRERDAFLDADDRIEILIDTFLDKRNAFWFQMNASDCIGDSLITDNGSDFNKPWDGIWRGRSRVDELGWAVEMAIPFKTLSFKKGLDTWGLNITRYVGRKNERIRWNNGNRDVSSFTIAEAGLLEGLEGIRQGIGLDTIPFFTGSWNKDRTDGEGDTDLIGDPGVDLFYRLSTNLTLSVTVNTDFAETEVDQRQINLTRFPLFFPERRDFFLQDSGNFNFGPQRSRGGGRFRPFFSRRIGLVDGQVVPLLGGVKLTGRAGDYNLGFLDVQTDEVRTDSSGDIDSQNLFVGRVAKNLGDQSSIGAIVTNGNPTGGPDNTVFGVDSLFRTTKFLGEKTLEGILWGIKSYTEGVSGDDAAYGFAIRYPNDIWRWGMRFTEVQENYESALGFVPRENIRQYSGEISYQPRIDEKIRNLEFSIDVEAFTDTEDVLETVNVEVQPFGIQSNEDDGIRVEIEHTHDELREDFEISDGIVIPTGAYDFTRYRLEMDSSQLRPIAGNAGFTVGDFYDGTRTDLFAGLSLRYQPLLTTSIELRQSRIDLEDGEFTTQIASGRFNFSFSQALSWNNVLQWDNVSETIGLNSRLRWIPTPGHEVFLVVNETVDEDGPGLVSEFTQVAFKMIYTIRI